MLSNVSYQEIKDIEQSEIAYTYQQAMCRGSCRIIADGKAKPMKVWLIHRGKQIRERLDVVMPGVKWKTWETEQAKPEGKVQQTVKKIRDYLMQLDSCVQQIPIKMN